ncbi:uncharacterized protein N7477_005108 [Penicillium maclennaniae]|uniref:uncharacterized protein n=1 Tax=Penicillium maclennaniae TaxID=1343394 RepID=UPI00254056AC|nr:uncharacterized protein N7477_005108 [Penicillium maclennaniae]KAJ5675174.1 hypothetical protein N7477_005108 [Penicillium maclennaniae]
MPEGSHDRSLLRRVIEAALFREDNHYPPMAAHAAAAAERSGMPDVEAGKRFTLPVNDPDHLIPPNNKLLIFRALTGIDSVPALTSGGHLLRTAPNVGIYTRVPPPSLPLEQLAGPHSAVTAFGAINTIMAGILTYLRGSGLPDRLKAYQNKWKNIREYIEQREREFCLVGCDLDVQEEVFIVESMYQSVKSEMETTKSTGDGRSQQPDDPRIRRSLLPSSHELSGQRAATTPSKRAEVVCSHHSRDDEAVSPITIPEKTA